MVAGVPGVLGEKRSHSEQRSGRRDQQRSRSLAHRSAGAAEEGKQGEVLPWRKVPGMTPTLSHLLGIPCLGMQ